MTASVPLPTSIFLTHGGNQLGISASPISPVVYISNLQPVGWASESCIPRESYPGKLSVSPKGSLPPLTSVTATQVPANVGTTLHGLL